MVLAPATEFNSLYDKISKKYQNQTNARLSVQGLQRLSLSYRLM